MSYKRAITKDQYDILMLEIRAIKKSLDKINDNQNPTFPLYDQTNFPQDPVPGQVAIDPADGTGWTYTDEQGWRRIQ